MTCVGLQIQYDKIYAFFKKTNENFDFLNWDGKSLYVWENNKIIEKYSLKDLLGKSQDSARPINPLGKLGTGFLAKSVLIFPKIRRSIKTVTF